MKKITRIAIPFSCIILIIVLGVVFLYQKKGQSSLSLIHPQRGDIADAVSFFGKVQAKNIFEVSFERSGKVSKVLVHVGDTVKRGQVLAELNSEEVGNTYAQALSDQGVARAQLQQAQEERDTQKAKLRSIKKSSSSNQYDEKAQEQVINQSDANVKAKEVLVIKADEMVANAGMQSKKVVLNAPVSGIVTKQLLTVGKIVSASVPVMALVEDDALEIQAYVSEVEVANISVGAKASIDTGTHSDALDKMEAVVAIVDPIETAFSGTSAYKITLTPLSPNGVLKSGMGVESTLIQSEHKNALIIPRQSVFTDDGKTFVLAVTNGVQRKKEVVLGIKDQSERVEVLSGVNEEDTLVAFSQF